MNTEIIFSEYFSKNAVDVDGVKRYFPEAKISLYNEDNTEFAFDRDHPRFGWRMHDLNQLERMLTSKADIAIAFDADMKIVNDDVRRIIPLADRFGFCLPCNNRHLVRVDTQIGADSDGHLDNTNGTGYAFNTAILAFRTGHMAARSFLSYAAHLMRRSPMRLPLVLWRAAYEKGFFPCLLPPQWCVCQGDEGCKDPIILHIGHEPVRRYYSEYLAS